MLSRRRGEGQIYLLDSKPPTKKTLFLIFFLVVRFKIKVWGVKVTVFSFVDTFLVGLLFHNQQSKESKNDERTKKESFYREEEEENFFSLAQDEGEKNPQFRVKDECSNFYPPNQESLNP